MASMKEQGPYLRIPDRGFAPGHSEDCLLFRAANCAVPIECEHGHDVCPFCDPCTCGANSIEEENC